MATNRLCHRMHLNLDMILSDFRYLSAAEFLLFQFCFLLHFGTYTSFSTYCMYFNFYSVLFHLTATWAFFVWPWRLAIKVCADLPPTPRQLLMDPANEKVASIFAAYTQTCDETDTAPPLSATLVETAIPHTQVSPPIHIASTLDGSNVGFSVPLVGESCSSMILIFL